MFISVIRYLRGYLRIQIIGYSPERFINTCSYHGIYIWNLTPSKGSYEMNILASDFTRLKPFLRKTDTKVRIVEKYGFPFFFFRYRKRKLFFVGFALFLFLIYGLSEFAWEIDFVGNQKYTDEILLNFLEKKGIHYGMKMDQIECSRIVKDIRKEYEDIVWVSASIDGCRLMVRIKENENSLYDPDDSKDGLLEAEIGTDLIADADGTIREIITRAGIPLVKEGDSVKKGDILISGAVPIYNDSGELTDIRLQKADADIILEYVVNYEDSVPISKEKKVYSEQEKKAIAVRVFNYFIRIGGSRMDEQMEEIITTKSNVSVGMNSFIPISFYFQTIKPYQSKYTTYSDDEIQKMLTESFQKFCDDQKKKGVEIIRNNVKIYKEEKLATAKGTLVVRASVGEEKKTTITEDIKNGND